MQPPEGPEEKHWHVDRRVPLAVIITLLLTFAGQTATAAWYMSKLDQRVESLEQARTATAPQGDRLTRVEVKLESALDGISEIKSILRKEPSPLKVR